MRAIDDIICWDQLVRLFVELNCWGDLLRLSVDINHWDDLLRPAVKIIKWCALLRLSVDYLLRSAVEILSSAIEIICWDQLLRLSAEINSGNQFLRSAVEIICWLQLINRSITQPIQQASSHHSEAQRWQTLLSHTPTKLRLAHSLARTTRTRNETHFPIGGLLRRLIPLISDLSPKMSRIYNLEPMRNGQEGPAAKGAGHKILRFTNPLVKAHLDLWLRKIVKLLQDMPEVSWMFGAWFGKIKASVKSALRKPGTTSKVLSHNCKT